MRAHILGLVFVAGLAAAGGFVACTGAETPDGACAGSDPNCNDAGTPGTDSATGSTEAGPAADASGPVTDAALEADALCTLIVDDAGVSHGCGPGDNGPGDHDDGGGATPPPSTAAPDASDLPLGASCLDNAQCQSGICFDYQVRGTFCTQRCWTNANCPPPANGCNGMGVCRFGDGG